MNKEMERSGAGMIGPQTYALGLLNEESGEIVQLVGKAIRFGLDTPHRPDRDDGPSARLMLETEIGDFLAAVEYAELAGLIDRDRVYGRRRTKLAKLLDPMSKDNLGRRLAPDPSPLSPSGSVPLYSEKEVNT